MNPSEGKSLENPFRYTSVSQRISRSLSLCMALALIVFATNVSWCQNAQPRRVTVWSPGAWVQKTQGAGQDDIHYAVLAVVTTAQGKRTVTANQYHMGIYNDHGGPSKQQVRAQDFAVADLYPGDQLDVLIAAYGYSDGGLFPKVSKFLSDELRKRAGQAAASGNPYAIAVTQYGPQALDMFSRALTSVGGHAGTVRVKVKRSSTGDPDGDYWSWNYQGYGGGTFDGGRQEPEMYYTIGLHLSGDYWLQLAVRDELNDANNKGPSKVGAPTDHFNRS